MSVQELLQERAGLVKNMEDILIQARAETRNPSVDEFQKIKNMEERIGEIERTVDVQKFIDARIGGLDKGFQVADHTHVPDNAQRDSFGSLGEMLVAVAAAGSPAGRFRGAGKFDTRLSNILEAQSAAAGSSANVPADGGFLVVPTRASEIIQKTYEGGAILSRCATYDVGENSDSLEVPYVDESSRANGSRWGGLRAYREGEVETPTSTKTKMGLWECRVQDLKALCYVTDRLLQDAPALESLIMDQMPQEFTFKLEDEILNGSGANQCKGVIGETATVSVAKEAGQAAATLTYENIVKMWARGWGRGRANAAWFYNQDIEPQLFQMVLSVGTGGVPAFMPPNGLSQAPYGTLMGRPAIPVEQAATLGTVGDIMLADWSQYALVRKGGLKTASSIHVKFLTDEMTFKFNMRVNGKPKWKTALTPFKGSNTLSPFVTLATRA